MFAVKPRAITATRESFEGWVKGPEGGVTRVEIDATVGREAPSWRFTQNNSVSYLYKDIGLATSPKARIEADMRAIETLTLMLYASAAGYGVGINIGENGCRLMRYNQWSDQSGSLLAQLAPSLKNRWVRVVITEGRNREVRKLFDTVGHAVSRLIRIRYGSVVLPKGLRRGVWVDLPVEDVKALRSMTSGGAQPAGPGGPKPVRPGAPATGPRGRKNARRGRQRDAGSGGLSPGMAEAVDGDSGDAENFARIPNPLQQTYDKRAIQQARRVRDIDEDGPIPNPLQQTYDRRAVQAEARPRRELDEDGPIPNPLQQTYDKRFVKPAKAAAGGGAGRPRKKPAGGKAQPGGQPDPMQTSVGYIGADAFHQKGKSGRSGKGGRRR